MSDQGVISFVVTNPQILEAGLSASNVFTVSGGFIGSGLTDDWCLKDGAGDVRESHCRIVYVDGFFCLSDVSNATYINGSLMAVGRKTLARLNEKDVLNIGPYKIRVSFELSADEMSQGPQTIDRLFSVDEDELNLNRFDLVQDQAQAHSQPHIAYDPLLALDELEEHVVEEDLINEPEPDQEELDKEALTEYLLAQDQVWKGPELLVQADSERDSDSAIALQTSSQKKPLSLSKTIEKEESKGLFSKAKSKAESFKQNSKKTISTLTKKTHNNWNLATKESQMDEEVLDLLEKEMGMDFSQEAPEGEGNHLLTGPIFRGLGVNAANNDNAADLQLLSEEMGAASCSNKLMAGVQ